MFVQSKTKRDMQATKYQCKGLPYQYSVTNGSLKVTTKCSKGDYYSILNMCLSDYNERRLQQVKELIEKAMDIVSDLVDDNSIPFDLIDTPSLYSIVCTIDNTIFNHK